MIWNAYRDYYLALKPRVRQVLLGATTLLLVGSLVAAALRAERPTETPYSKLSTRNVLNRGAK